jgi:hypothetical protein
MTDLNPSQLYVVPVWELTSPSAKNLQAVAFADLLEVFGVLK